MAVAAQQQDNGEKNTRSMFALAVCTTPWLSAELSAPGLLLSLQNWHMGTISSARS